VLPLATYSHLFGTVNLSNLFKFLNERLAKDAQWEIRQYAAALLKLAEPIAPVAVKCFVNDIEWFDDL
jgi:thymidylate synthase (FAD)